MLPTSDVKLWLPFIEMLKQLPIYLIICHASLCISSTKCNNGKGTFKLNKNSFLLNLSAGGEYVWFNDKMIQTIISNKEEIPLYLGVTDRSDINTLTDDYTPLLSLMNRATECDYPIFNCTFNDPKRPSFGVYTISKQMLLTQNDNMFKDFNRSRNWELNEIIEQVYSMTRTTNGIFVFSGCSDAHEIDMKNHASMLKFNTLRQIIRIEDLAYSSKVPTLDNKYIHDIFKNNANMFIPSDYHGNVSKFLFTVPGAYAMAEFAHTHGHSRISNILSSDDEEGMDHLKQMKHKPYVNGQKKLNTLLRSKLIQEHRNAFLNRRRAQVKSRKDKATSRRKVNARTPTRKRAQIKFRKNQPVG